MSLNLKDFEEKLGMGHLVKSRKKKVNHSYEFVGKNGEEVFVNNAGRVYVNGTLVKEIFVKEE